VPAVGRAKERLIVVSNRLPFEFKRGTDRRWRTQRGAGGLISALLPVLRDRGGTWIGWHGSADNDPDLEQAVAAAGTDVGFALKAVLLDAPDVDKFYHGFSNEIIWPMFHDLQSLCNFDPSYWGAFQRINQRFAQVVAKNTGSQDFVWIHDYHLMNVAAELRALGCRARTGFFLHIPFPSPDIFLALPWRLTLLQALLEHELIGFQTPRDRNNFVQCLRALLGDVEVQGRGDVVTVTAGTRMVRVGSFPISIDYNSFMRQASTPQVAARAEELHKLLPLRKLLLGIDRLDYTKGIPHRLAAFRNALERYPDLRERISLIEVVVPGGVDVAQYHELKTRIEQLVGQINGSFVQPGGWVPVWYAFGNLSRTDLLAYYRAADIALITPLKDGMNLVAKEYCACSIEEDCVLILSEFAGAAAQLQRGALLVNPYDIEGVADAIHSAFHMDKAERRARMRRLRRSIREYDVFRWVDGFLKAAIAKDLKAFPAPAGRTGELMDDYIPI
jgi:trehalose 6-phosphate synthase/phosphatase